MCPMGGWLPHHWMPIFSTSFVTSIRDVQTSPLKTLTTKKCCTRGLKHSPCVW
jgi:hypothetical protein